MFKDKIFNISVLLSFCLHIACIFIFVLVITPKGFTFNKFPTIAFLGPILEDGVVYGSYSASGSAPMLTPYREDFTRILSGAFNPFLRGKDSKEAIVLKSDYLYNSALADKTLDQPALEEVLPHKQIPDFLKVNPEEFKKEDLPRASNFQAVAFNDIKLKGQLVLRNIIYRPPVPVLPEWAKALNEDFKIDLKISVSPQGYVRSVSVLNVTGYPELDMTAFRYARGLIFQSLPVTAAQDGEIEIILKGAK